MTTSDTALVCPACGKRDCIEQSTGYLCLACMYEGPFVTPDEYRRDETGELAQAIYERATPPGSVDAPQGDGGGDTSETDATFTPSSATPVAPPMQERSDIVSDSATDTEHEPPIVPEMVDALVGKRVHVLGYDIDCKVTSVHGDVVIVRDQDGDSFDIKRDECVELAPDAGSIDNVHPYGQHDETTDPAVMFAIAAAIMTAGADAVLTDDTGRRTMAPPVHGWAPPPANEVPEMELAAAYVVAVLMLHYDIATSDVRAMAANLMQAASADSNTDTESETDSDEAE